MTGATLIERREFIADGRQAVTTRRPFAAGKIGFSEQRCWIDMPPAHHPPGKDMLTDGGACW
jgi:hypothetical protein